MINVKIEFDDGYNLVLPWNPSGLYHYDYENNAALERVQKHKVRSVSFSGTRTISEPIAVTRIIPNGGD